MEVEVERLEGLSSPRHPYVHHRTRRFHVTLLLMSGFACSALLCTNIGMTMNCMINSTALLEQEKIEHPVHLNESLSHIPPQCQADSSSAVNDYGGSLRWSVREQGWVIGATFVGGLVTVLPAGWLSDKVSARHTLCFCVLLLSLCNVLLPSVAVHLGSAAVIALRFVIGMGEGMFHPALNKVLIRWIPTSEKGTAASLFTSGNQLTGLVATPVIAALCASSFGWPAVYYMSAAVGVIWCGVWMWCVRNSPEKSRWMTDDEIAYLQHNLPKKSGAGKQSLPLLSLFTSPAFLALVFCSFVCNCIITFIQIYIPAYFKDVLYLNVKSNGVFSALPHLLQLVCKVSWGLCMDGQKKAGRISPTASVRLSQLFSSVATSGGMVALALLVDCSTPIRGLVLFCVICGMFGICINGFMTSLLSIAPRYIGMLTSINMLVGYMGRIAAPQLITFFKTIGTLEEWRHIFLSMAALYIASAIPFALFGSGTVLEWAKTPRGKTGVLNEVGGKEELIKQDE